MKNFYLKSNLLFASLLLVQSCASSQIKIHQYENGRIGYLVNSNRVLVECEDLFASGGDRPGSFGFSIHILDEENTVLSGIQSTQTTKKDCFSKVRIIEKILRESKTVYIAGVTNLEKPRSIEQDRKFNFPKIGTYYGNGRPMQWYVLKGEDGPCVTAYDGDGKPCPWDPIFPAETIPFNE